MYSVVSGFCWWLGERDNFTGKLIAMNNERMQTLELLFPGNLVASLVTLSFFCATHASLCYREIEISVHNIDTYKQLQVQ